MPLADIQSHLHGIYDLPMRHRVEDFLVTDRATLRQVEAGASIRDGPEKLLFSEHHGELLMSLYLDAELLGSLEAHNPFQRLDRDNLAAFCLALEGVSHFVYLSFNAGHERPVSQLELELQAEVDKFILVFLLADRQGTPVSWERLSHWLFDQCRFADQLDDEERSRYENANRLARAFCARLADQHPGDTGGEIFTLLRRFYRRRHSDKLGSAAGSLSLRAP